MKNDSFLKKFQGRTEIIGRGGLTDIMNNVHINVKDYQVKPKKQFSKVARKKSSPKNEYNYIKSEISKEFNKNKNYIPQLRSLSMSAKPKKNNDNFNNNNNNIRVNNNIKNNNSRSKQNIYDTQHKNSIQKNRVTEHLKKSKEKPIKLFKNSNENEILAFSQKDNKEKNSNSKKEEIKNNNKKQSPDKSNKNNKNNNNQYKDSKNRNRIKIDAKLPSIVRGSVSPIPKSKNIFNPKVKANKSYERVNTYTPYFKKDFKDHESEKNYQSLKEILGNKVKNKRDNNDIFQSNSLNLPKINVNKKLINSSNKNLKEFTNQRNNFIQKNYNNILHNIKNDFLLLDSIKNRTNQLDKNKNFTERNYQNRKINFQTNNKGINNNFKIINKNINNFNKIKDYNISNNNNYSKNNINNYNGTNNQNNLIEYNSSYNLNNFIEPNNSDMLYLNDINNKEKKDNINYRYNEVNNNSINSNIYKTNNNDNSIFDSYEKKKAHTSFDNPPVLPKLKKKLDIINEENEDDNKFITDFQINNNIGNDRNLNTLEILMKQRMFYQNKMPNNSRFKLKQISEDQ